MNVPEPHFFSAKSRGDSTYTDPETRRRAAAMKKGLLQSSFRRNVVIATNLARLMGFLSFALLLILVTLFGTSSTSPIIVAIGLFFFVIAYLNKKGFINTGRMLLSTLPAIMTVVAALVAKIYSDSFTDILYYDARFFIVLFTIVPCLVFSTREPVQLYGSLLIILMCLLLFDPVHELLNVGYFQRGFKGTSYYYINYVAVITFFGIAAGAIILKWVIEKGDEKNSRIKSHIVKKNRQLSELLKDVEAQNEEIISQSEELYTSQEQLLAANQLIEKQKQALQSQVNQVNASLEEANDELIKHNNELRQFSYTISHNLRGPVARLLGLAEIAMLEEVIRQNPNAAPVIGHIKKSAQELDNVIRDLNKIVDIRNSIYQVKQRVDFIKEWTDVKSLLHVNESLEARSFRVDFSGASHIYSVKPMVNSILFNLVSNAIKYQSPQRELMIHVSTYRNDTHTVLEVRDNGLGINLEMFQKDMFKMYKRFHSHQEGKGLGLYLIKSQAESLNGFVEVASKINQGTIFKVHLKHPVAVDDQVCLESDDAKIFYNAVQNFIVIRWLRSSPGDSTPVYLDALEFFRMYHVPVLINDVRLLASEQNEHHFAMLEKICRDAANQGLLQLGILCHAHQFNDAFRKHTTTLLEKHRITVLFGDGLDQLAAIR